MLGLRNSRDRLALGRALALGLRVAVTQGARQALPLPLRLQRLGCWGLLCRSFCFGGFGSRCFGLDVRRRLGLGDGCLFGRRLLGGRLFGHRVLGCRGLLGHRRFGCRLICRLLLGFGRISDRPLGGGDSLFSRLLVLFGLFVLCLLVLFFVSHSSLDSRSLLVRSGQSRFGRSRAWPASGASCSRAPPPRPGSAG